MTRTDDFQNAVEKYMLARDSYAEATASLEKVRQATQDANRLLLTSAKEVGGFLGSNLSSRMHHLADGRAVVVRLNESSPASPLFEIFSADGEKLS